MNIESAGYESKNTNTDSLAEVSEKFKILLELYLLFNIKKNELIIFKNKNIN